MQTVEQFAEVHNIKSHKTIEHWCEKGYIPGAKKIETPEDQQQQEGQKFWLIPDHAMIPYTENRYRKGTSPYFSMMSAWVKQKHIVPALYDVEHFCILFLFRRYHLQIVFHVKLPVLKSTFSYIHCRCLLKFSPSPMFATIGLLWLLLTSCHSLLLTDFILCFCPLTRPPLVPHVTFSPCICHIYYSYSE